MASPPPSRRAWAAPALYLCAAALIAGPGLLPDRVLLPLDLVADLGAWKPDPAVRVPVSNGLLSDPILLHRPYDAQIRRALARGEVPWTNPYSGSGAPLFANPQVALFSPFTWVRLLFPERGWALSVLLKLFLGALGLRAFARELGASPRAALVSGLLYELSGYSILWGLYPPTHVFAFLPWLGAAGHRLLFRPSGGAALRVVAFAALATAGGHPETLAFGVAGLAAFLAIESRGRRLAGGPRPAGRAIAGTVAAAACGFCLLAVQLVPFARLLPESGIVDRRAHAPASGFRAYAAAGQVLPGFLGSPLRGELDLSGAFFGSENMNMRSGAFVGLVTLVVLALAWRGLAAVFRRGLLVALVALAVSWRVPPLGWLWGRAPLVSLFATEYAAAAVVLFAAAASGPALDALSARVRRPRAAAAALIAAGLALAVAGVLPSVPAARPALEASARSGIERLRSAGHLKQPGTVYAARLMGYLDRGRATALRRIALPGCIWILGGIALASVRRRFTLLSLAAASELAAFGFGYLPAVRRSEAPPTAPAIADLLRRGTRSGMLAASFDVYPPDLATLDGLRDARSDDPLETASWNARLRRCGYDEAARAFPEARLAPQIRCLESLGVRYFLTREAPPGAERVGGGEPPAVGAYELPSPAPPPPARDGPPDGLALGALVSLGAAVGAIVTVRAAGRPEAV